ncbi:MAG: IS21 family transposase, partial [Singulisphaera sp.]|nr:IS21 family transposase [Singulisphaera sp.]
EPRSVDSLSLVRFDANDYSVPTAYAHYRVTVVGTVDTVRVVFGDRVVAGHHRRWDREQVTYDPVHYLALLERKPGALDFAAPLEGWELPVCFGVLRRRLEAEFGSPGTRQFIKVLRLLEGVALGELTRAVERALELGTADADAVRLILEHRREQPVGLFSLDGRPHLKLVGVPAPDLTAYRAQR